MCCFSKDILVGELLSVTNILALIKVEDAIGIQVDRNDLEVHVTLEKVVHELHVGREVDRDKGH